MSSSSKKCFIIPIKEFLKVINFCLLVQLLLFWIREVIKTVGLRDQINMLDQQEKSARIWLNKLELVWKDKSTLLMKKVQACKEFLDLIWRRDMAHLMIIKLNIKDTKELTPTIINIQIQLLILLMQTIWVENRVNKKWNMIKMARLMLLILDRRIITTRSGPSMSKTIDLIVS